MSMNLALWNDHKPRNLRLVNDLIQTPSELTYRLMKLSDSDILKEYGEFALERLVGSSREDLEAEPNNPHLHMLYESDMETYEQHMEKLRYHLADGYKFTMI